MLKSSEEIKIGKNFFVHKFQENCGEISAKENVVFSFLFLVSCSIIISSIETKGRQQNSKTDKQENT